MRRTFRLQYEAEDAEYYDCCVLPNKRQVGIKQIAKTTLKNKQKKALDKKNKLV